MNDNTSNALAVIAICIAIMFIFGQIASCEKHIKTQYSIRTSLELSNNRNLIKHCIDSGEKLSNCYLIVKK